MKHFQPIKDITDYGEHKDENLDKKKFVEKID